MTSSNNHGTRLSAGTLLAYASLRMPLALLELPLYVLLPSLYSASLGMELALVGTVLFATRLIDALLDPVIGNAIDNDTRHRHFRHWIWWALPFLALGFAGLLNPPPEFSTSQSALVLTTWLAILSMVTYIAYSIVSIAYQAWGAQLARGDAERARVTGYRESAGLVGVLLAATLLVPQHALALTALFIVMAIAAAALLRLAPATSKTSNVINDHAHNQRQGMATSLRHVFPSKQFRWLLLVFSVNGVATAIPATLVLFYVADVLRSPDRAPVFLAAYFLAGAVGMPLWLYLSRRYGLTNSWMIGMGISVIAFIWALGLGPGDDKSFMTICLITGLALGADLAIAPALLARVIAGNGDLGKHEGTYFGVWNFATKMNLAAAAGLTLPLLSVAGYRPGISGSLALILTYAAVPCVLKLAACAALFISPLRERKHVDVVHARQLDAANDA